MTKKIAASAVFITMIISWGSVFGCRPIPCEIPLPDKEKTQENEQKNNDDKLEKNETIKKICELATRVYKSSEDLSREAKRLSGELIRLRDKVD